jgi:hypothetical protein
LAVATIGAMALSATGVAVLPGVAQATTASSDCTAYAGGPMCYFFRSNYGGARAAINYWVNDLYAYEFSNTGSGAYVDVANHAGSGINEDTTSIARIWEHVNQTGLVKELNWHGYVGDRDETLDALNNNNRSQSWR